VASAYSQVVLAKGPVGYWRLGEASGLAAFDSSGSGIDGTYNGSPSLGQAGAIADDPDTAVGLNGPDSGDYVEVPDPDDQSFSQPTSGAGLTVEAWMRPDALLFSGQTDNHYVHWLGKGATGCEEWGMRFYSHDSTRPNRISAYIWNPAGGEGAGAYFEDDLSAGDWIHIVAVYDPGDMNTPMAGVHIYKNGIHRKGPSPKDKGTLYSSYEIVPAHGNAPVRLGTRDGVSFLTGGLDEVAIYSRALSAAEIMENYAAGN
jgi:concanavalin A-like lectin/glucanase superfamily protein